MKVALDLSPLYSEHQVRGIGFYTQRLFNSLKQIKDNLELMEIQNFKVDDYGEADLLHIPYFSPFFVSLPLIIKKPFIVTVHDLIPLKYPDHFPPGVKGRVCWEIQKRLLKRSRAVLTDSKASAVDIEHFAGINTNKIHTVYLAADPIFNKINNKKILDQIVKQYKLPQRFVLYVGDINWNKNVPGLIKSCQKIRIPLVLVGKQVISESYDHQHPENQDLVKIQKIIKDYPYTRNGFGILPLGFVPTKDLVAIYNLATVYVQPSFDEGFGLPVLEAMACGCPTVVSKYGSLPEISGDASVIVDPYNTDGITNGINKILNNDILRQQLKVKGIQQTKMFNWGKTARQTVEVYRKALLIK